MTEKLSEEQYLLCSKSVLDLMTPLCSIIESINLMPYNEAALHTTAGCMKGDAPNQSGFTGSTDCSISTGCTVLETKENSLSSGFAAAGGGVWAVQFDVAGYVSVERVLCIPKR